MVTYKGQLCQNSLVYLITWIIIQQDIKNTEIITKEIMIDKVYISKMKYSLDITVAMDITTSTNDVSILVHK